MSPGTIPDILSGTEECKGSYKYFSRDFNKGFLAEILTLISGFQGENCFRFLWSYFGSCIGNNSGISIVTSCGGSFGKSFESFFSPHLGWKELLVDCLKEMANGIPGRNLWRIQWGSTEVLMANFLENYWRFLRKALLGDLPNRSIRTMYS